MRINGALVLLPTNHLNNCVLLHFLPAHTKLLTAAAINGPCMRVCDNLCYSVVARVYLRDVVIYSVHASII